MRDGRVYISCNLSHLSDELVDTHSMKCYIFCTIVYESQALTDMTRSWRTTNNDALCDWNQFTLNILPTRMGVQSL